MKDQVKQKALFESQPILRAILTLAVPTVVGQIILVVYNIADTFFVGMTGNDAMVTAVTICMPAFMFLSAISNLFGVGGASVISRALGAQDRARAKNASAFSFWGCLLLTAVYILGVVFLLNPFIDVLGGSDVQVHGLARGYLLITVVAGGLFAAMSTFLAHLVRSEGRSIHASAGIAMGGLINIALDPLFMFVLLPKGQEVAGAALATATSNLIASAYFAWVVWHGRENSTLRFKPSASMFNDGIASAVLACGLPACLMTLFENVSYAVLDNLMAAGGVAMQAGIGVAKKVNMLAHCTVRGMAQGVLPLISYNYASGNHQRMRRAVLISTGISVGLATCCMIANRCFGEYFVGLFIQEGTTSFNFGVHFLDILCLGCPFSACAYAVISFFQAVGQGFKSFLLAILRKGLLDIPMMFLLRLLGSVEGIVWATPVVDLACCVAAIGLFAAFLRQYVNHADAPISA